MALPYLTSKSPPDYVSVKIQNNQKLLVSVESGWDFPKVLAKHLKHSMFDSWLERNHVFNLVLLLMYVKYLFTFL